MRPSVSRVRPSAFSVWPSAITPAAEQKNQAYHRRGGVPLITYSVVDLNLGAKSDSGFGEHLLESVCGCRLIRFSRQATMQAIRNFFFFFFSCTSFSYVLLIVDSKARSFARYGDIDLVKPNASELSSAADLPAETDAEVEERPIAGALELWAAKGVLVTRAAKGVALGLRGQPVRHFPTAPRGVVPRLGAGDTAPGGRSACRWPARGLGRGRHRLRPARVRRRGRQGRAPPRSAPTSWSRPC